MRMMRRSEHDARVPIRTHRSVDPVTRTTRVAANAAALAVAAWALMFAATTQMQWVRAASSFADDPWDLIASYAAIGLSIVVAVTALRSVRHREPILLPATAARIRLGAAIALAIVGTNVLSDALALAVVPLPVPEAATEGRLVLIAGLVVVTGAASTLAGALLFRAQRIAALAAAHVAPEPPVAEPDILDDALGLTEEVLGHLPAFSKPGRQLVAQVRGFLDRAPISPRRHRLAFGLVGAVAVGFAFAVWHALREGAWASPFAALAFASLASVGVLLTYLATLRPLRLIRPI
jgi:hypothetical protein